MRARLLLLVAALLFATALPSQASVTSDGPFLNSFKFWSPSICMAIGDTGLNAAPLAQAWNSQTPGQLAITASNNCVTAGYPPSRRFTIDAYNGATSKCLILTDRSGNAFDPAGDATASGGHWVYNDNPMIWVNRNCYGTLAARDHYASAGIGQILGLATLNSPGNDSRVVNMTDWSIRNVTSADPYSGAVLGRLYG
jgi:hypothetical protein